MSGDPGPRASRAEARTRPATLGEPELWERARTAVVPLSCRLARWPPLHQVRAKFGNRPAADQRHRPLHVGGKQFQNAVHTPLADRSQAIEVGTAHHARAGAECHRLDDVAAATDSAIADNLSAVPDDIGDLRYELKGRR